MHMQRIGLILLLLVLIITSTTISAQSPQIITVAVPSFWQILFDEQVLADFEAQHNVDVQVVYDAIQPQSKSIGLDSQYADTLTEALVDYAQAADVLYVGDGAISPEATRTGVFLDLWPLISSDPDINPDDFYPAMWNAFRWDDGMWGLPVAGSTTLVEYIPATFDEKRVAYPDAHWSIEQFADAARQLAEYDENGNVTLPGMLIGTEEQAVLFSSLIGQNYSDNQIISMPQFPIDALVPLLETWQTLQDEGVVVNDPAKYLDRMNEIPMRLGGGSFMSVTISSGDTDGGNDQPGSAGLSFTENAPQTALAPLPNFTGSVSAQGFAVSSGTTNPQLAYELVRYLSERPEVAQSTFGMETARRSYATSSIESEGPQVAVVIGSTSQRSDADRELINQVLENGLSNADLRFSQYLAYAPSLIRQGMDVRTALSQLEVEAIQVVSAFSGRDIKVFVNTPVPVTLPEGKIELSFGLMSFIQPLPNRDEWDRLASEFAMNDPEVGLVTIDSGSLSPDGLLSDHDCAYQSSIAGFTRLDSEKMLPLDPLLNADTNYNVNDLPVGVLAQVQIENQTYALPITLRPEVLTYNPDAIAATGLSYPPVDWDFSAFVDYLKQLDSVLDENTYPLEAISPTNNFLLMLIAAQGGLLFDTSVEPIMIDFTSPDSVNAIRSVLDLARDGLLKYQPLGTSPGLSFFAISGIESANLQASNFFGGVDDTTQLVPYPSGRYIPISFDVGAGFISTDSSHPEACYRWLSYIANHPYVFTDMPALLNTLDDPSVASAAGPAMMETYHSVAEAVGNPNAVNPIMQDPFISFWLNGAFDAYVLEDADLESELANAEQLTHSYVTCLANSGGDPDSVTQKDRQTCYNLVNSSS